MFSNKKVKKNTKQQRFGFFPSPSHDRTIKFRLSPRHIWRGSVKSGVPYALQYCWNIFRDSIALSRSPRSLTLGTRNQLPDVGRLPPPRSLPQYFTFIALPRSCGCASARTRVCVCVYPQRVRVCTSGDFCLRVRINLTRVRARIASSHPHAHIRTYSYSYIAFVCVRARSCVCARVCV